MKKYSWAQSILPIFVHDLLKNKKLTKRIRHIAEVQTGVFAKRSSEGEVIYLSPNYFDEYGELQTKVEPDLMRFDVNDKHILEPGDVIFSAKGNKNFAHCFKELASPAVGSTSFFRIKIITTLVLPEYLTWYLNHPNTIKYLQSFARGSRMPSITKDSILNLDMPVPSIEKQQTILKIDQLRKQEQELRADLSSLRNALIQQSLINTTIE